MCKFINWMEKTYDADQLRGIAQHGCDGGWPHITYYTETKRLFGEFEEEIWGLVGEIAEMENLTPVELVAKDTTVYDEYTFANRMVWYAVEWVACGLIDTEGEA